MVLTYSILGFYLLLLLTLIFVWQSIKQGSGDKEHLPCSVIIPFRNEARNLPALIKSLKNQTHTSFELIFVNDHSDDGGDRQLTDLLSNFSLNWSLISLEGGEGKKAAISKGIAAAKFDLIATTDADCVMGKEWLAVLTEPLMHDQIKLVTGPVALKGNGWWPFFQQLENLALMGFTASTIQMSRPTMANGANLAFRKSVFEEVGGYEGIDHIPTGDDELFMHKVHKKCPGSIRFIKNSDAKVETEAFSELRQVVNQKRRWASKWKVNRRPSNITLALFILLVNLSQAILIVDAILGFYDLQISRALLISKLIFEFFFIDLVGRSFKERVSFFGFLSAFILYPIYAIYIGVTANFGQYEWKGRPYSVK